MLPVNVVPGVAVSRLVPSASISARSWAWLEDDTPTTATIAPIPMAIPSADSAARSRRVRSPWSAAPNSSRAGSRAAGTLAAGGGDGGGGAARRGWSSPLVGDDLAVAHLDPPVKGRGDARRRG